MKRAKIFGGRCLKEMLRDPTQDYNALIRKICIQQLGNTSGELAYEAAIHIGNALEIWSGMSYNYPFRGSANQMSIGTIMNEMPENILPTIKSYIGSNYVLSEPFYSNFEVTASELKIATDLLKQAMDSARSDQYVTYAYYTDPNVSRPTCKQYAELQYATTLLGSYYAQFRVNMLNAYKLLCKVDSFADVKQGIDDGSEAFQQYVELIKQDSTLQTEFADIIKGFMQEKNYISSVSLKDSSIKSLSSKARAKVRAYEKYLDKLQ